MWRGEGFTAVGEGMLQLLIYLNLIDVFVDINCLGAEKRARKGASLFCLLADLCQNVSAKCPQMRGLMLVLAQFVLQVMPYVLAGQFPHSRSSELKVQILQ